MQGAVNYAWALVLAYLYVTPRAHRTNTRVLFFHFFACDTKGREHTVNTLCTMITVPIIRILSRLIHPFRRWFQHSLFLLHQPWRRLHGLLLFLHHGLFLLFLHGGLLPLSSLSSRHLFFKNHVVYCVLITCQLLMVARRRSMACIGSPTPSWTWVACIDKNSWFRECTKP